MKILKQKDPYENELNIKGKKKKILKKTQINKCALIFNKEFNVRKINKYF